MPDSLFDVASGDGVELLPGHGSAVLHRRALSPSVTTEAFHELLDAVPWQQHDVRMFGRQVAQPRLVAWFGDPGRRYTYSGLTLDPLPWSDTLDRLRSACEDVAGARFNSALVNLYRDGRDSVAWHADDEPELGADPVIASVSLGAERRFDLRNRRSGETVRTLLPAASVLVMSGGCQRNWVHQAPKMLRVSKPRINLTFRMIMDQVIPGKTRRWP